MGDISKPMTGVAQGALSGFMELGQAMDIVLALATALYKRHGEITHPARNPSDVETALAVVEDFIVNQLAVEE